MSETTTRPLTEEELAVWPWLQEHSVIIALQPGQDGYLVRVAGGKWKRVKTLDQIPTVLFDCSPAEMSV